MADVWPFWLKCIFFLIFGILGTNSGGDPFAKQPRLIVEDGHLTIRSAFNRNVTLSSAGRGTIQINNVDVGKMMSAADAGSSLQSASVSSVNRRISDLMGQWNSVNALTNQISQLEENVTDLAQRLDQFIGSEQNRITNRGMRRYFAKVKKLEEKMNQLTELLQTDECSSNPCRNGGSCVDTYNGFSCKCPSNWEGPHCENDVNECALYSGTAFGCQNGATCINLQGSYRCDCPTNWYGIHCTEQHDDCSTASQQELCGHGTCINIKRTQSGQANYRCICEPGWTTGPSGPACIQDVNECEGPEPKCSVSPRVMCINLPGTFHCGPCPAGYTGNGLWCEDINECESRNGGCSTSPYVECYNTHGSRRCGPCPAGYFGNGEQCMYQSVCNNNRGGCHPLAMCIDNPAITATYRECRCPPGYIGNGEGLTGCIQSQGITCANNPCQHGTCQMAGNFYHCVCEAGYYGANCDTAEDPCFRMPCQNGGTCVRGIGSTFTCNCLEGYSGPTCADTRILCGGYLTGENGTLSYPPYSGNYDHGANCAWVITVEPSKVVNITFDHFRLEGGFNCEFDFLQLNDGPHAGSRVIGRFCSDELHGETFTSTHNEVYLWFRSDRSVSATGFTINWQAVEPVCGGSLNVSEYGSVKSPGYPGSYPVNRTCSWLVQVPFGKRIQFSFATLMLEHHSNCSFDFLKIYDGDSENDPEIGSYCSTTTPPPLITSGHSATLVFHSDNSIQDNGFNIAYSSVPAVQGCGGTITGPRGSVSSPSFPTVYQDNLLCEWLIRIHPDNRIAISFTDFHLEAHTNCAYDYVEVYDGETDESPLIGRFCGNTIPVDTISNSNKVYIRFRTDFSSRYPGFKLDYKPICGGVFTELTGTLTSPYYPDPYPANAVCLYDIRLPLGYLVNLTIHNINIEPHIECRFDYLEIRDGDSETARQMALLCSNTAPESILSTYNVMLMKFVTDGSVQGTGFSAQYEAVDIGCGGVMTEDNGHLSSPRHPDSYPHSTSCTWLIRAPDGFIIQITFSSFNLEANADCSYDYVLITDANGIPAGRFCGNNKPPVITSMDDTLIMQFVADASVARDGFTASYKFLDAKAACGGNFYQESGVIRSPGYPEHYPHNAHCVWVLHAQNGHQFALNTTNFHIEQHVDCKFDFLEIRNGGYDTSPVIGKFCGDYISPSIQSHSNVIRLEFKSDGSMSATGFEIYFDSSTVGCGGTLTTSRGSIVSPNYPQPYPLNAVCEWLIRVAAGSAISLTVVEIDVEEHDDCRFDYLQVFDGDSENSRSLIRLCNNRQNFGHIQSTGNTMLLRFRSDPSEAAGGFHVIYQTLCHNVLTKRRGVIESPNFPNSYPHNHNCSWVIQAPVGNNISISFSHLFIENHINCSLDYVEILENRPDGTVPRGKFCGDMSTPPETIHMGINSALIRLITDRSVSKEGFRLEWTMNGCGGDIYNKPSGVIVSPNYPNGYPYNTECTWNIWYPPGSRINFVIEELDIEVHPDCAFDFLAVYAGEDATAPQLLKLCDRVKNQTITSHGNQLFVHFKSDVSISYRGFKATFKQLPGGCGGIYKAQSGTILSPNFPDPYAATYECEYLIEVSPLGRVVLQFYDFEMPEANNCTNGYVAIYDGRNTSAPKLLQHCGQKPETPISSTGNNMLVKFQADGRNIAKGFRAHFSEGCGRRLLADSGGDIHSPNFPDIFMNAMNCSWIIYSSDVGQKVSLTVTHLLFPSTENCFVSSLQVFDGDMDDSPKLGEFCGSSVPPTIISRGNILHVFMVNQGIFRATYGLLSEFCGGILTSSSGSFASPGYPANYDIQMECVWIIEASAGNKVQLSFQSFHIEESDYCNTDYVEIHENDASGRFIGKYCGNNIPNNITAAEKLWIKFRSDDIGTATGFFAHYEMLFGNVLNGTSGNIASPGYPHRVQKAGEYEWTVIVPNGKFVSLVFIEFGISDMGMIGGSCRSYLQIFDGINNESPELGTFCGYQLPDPIVSTSNIVTIVSYNLAYHPFLFYIHWSAVSEGGVSLSSVSNSTCVKEYFVNSANSTIITSPNYPDKYPDKMDCTYMLRTNHTARMVVTFTNFTFEPGSPRCLYDRLESYYAPNPNIDSWVLNSTYCGTMPQFQIASNNNMLKLQMITDVIFNSTGFRAVASSECGGHIYGYSGILRSSAILPFFQNLSEHNSLQCEWVITVRQRRTIKLTFENFDIQSDPVCSTNYMMFRNGGSSTSPVLGSGRYCGSSPPDVHESNNNDIFVQLNYSPTSVHLPVFDLRYEELSMGCGGHIYINHDIPYAEISSPNYPSPPDHDIECDWIIISPSGTRLRVDFEEEFHLNRNCYAEDHLEYVELYDGGTMNAELIKRICGQSQPSSEMTTSNALLVKYVTSVQDPQAGFKATVRIAHCGGTISTYSSVITSPDYPQNYGSSIECEWFLKIKSNYQIVLTVTDFETPNANNCSYTDYLEIREMSPDGVKGDILTTLCGTQRRLPLLIEAPGAYAYIKFKSNSAVTAKGFSLRMGVNLDDGCGGTMQSPSGVITSPRYPNAIPSRRNCFWRIHAPEGRAVKVTFDALNLPFDERFNKCSSYVSIFNVTSRRISNDENYGHRYCGNVLPGELHSAASTLYIHYSQGGLSPGQGFSLRYSTEEPSICGGVLTGMSGLLQTPDFPVQPHSVIDCRWRIDIEQNKTLTLNFDYVILPGNKANFCRDGVIYILKGDSYLMGFCGNYSNGYFITSPYSSNSIRLIASLDKPFRGFRGTFNTSDCGGIVNGADAVITSPGYPNAYPQNINCHWLLEVPEGEIIRLSAEDLRLEEDCTKDYVKIRNGYYLDSPVIGHFCGNHNPVPIISSSNVISIIFHSDNFGTAPGFKFHTTEIQRGCGGIIQMHRGNISSPNYPSRYDNNIECVWTIEYTPGYLVNITFGGRFEIEMDATCSKDYLQIEDFTSDGTWTVRERKCGSSVPQSLLSKSHKLKLTFHSNNLIVGDGFNISYLAVCGGNFTTPSGEFISPNYPSSYANDMICTYTIGKTGDYISLKFDDYFSVEGADNCVYDYVEIFQIAENKARSQGKFCGSEPPADRMLQGPVIVKFGTDYTYVADGFKVRYEILSCGTVLTEPNGTISSPVIKTHYAKDVDCTWHITVDPRKVVAIRFLQFKLESSYRCYKSYLEIKEGNESGSSLGKLCGTEMRSIKSNSNQLTLRFHSKLYTSTAGFKLFYYSTYGPAEGCGGFINATSGELRSPDFDNDGNYDPNLDCVWSLVANVPDQVIKLHFEQFNIEGPQNGTCSEDYVEIREVASYGPLLGKYCGSVLPIAVIASSTYMFVHFHTNYAINKPGFKISFTMIPSPCGTSALISTPSAQTLTSPNFPNPYPVNLRCTWTIFLNETRVPATRRFVQVTVTELDVPCGGDYLQIRHIEPFPAHGTYSRPHTIQSLSRAFTPQVPVKACGSNQPQAINYEDLVEIVFHSDAVDNRARGFSLTFKDASCSGNFTEDGRILTSTAFPNRFNFETSCRINITVDYGKTISLYFKFFEAIYSNNCANSYMKVYDGNNVTASLLGTYCGFSLPNPIFSTGRSLFIDVHLAHTLGRFHLTYMATDKGRGCGGSVYGIEGAFSSPLYPAPYNSSAECIWRITVPGYHTVRLDFKSFALNSSVGCDSNYLEIFDGPTDDISVRVARFCGVDRPALLSFRTNQVVVKLVTDSSNNQAGFLVHFKSSSLDPDSSAVIMLGQP